MRNCHPILLFAFAFALLPGLSPAAVGQGDIPAGTVWYLHADLAGMRESGSGGQLYRWLDGEVFVELNEEVGIDVNEEVDRVTAYSGPEGGIVIVVEGPVKQQTRDKLLALVALDAGYDLRKHGSREYFRTEGGKRSKRGDGPLDDLGDNAFFSFAVPNRLLVTSREGEMQELLDRGGRIAGAGNHGSALLVLTADSTFVQAGLRANALAGDADNGWNSNILRNTEQAALLIADSNGMLAIEAQLTSRDPQMAQSLHSVINGIIGLQAFNSDLDPEIVTLINNTRVRVQDAVLSISTVFDPARLVKLLD